MGLCMSKTAEVVEVVAIAEIKQHIIPLIVEELRTIIIPQIIHALQMTEVQLDAIAEEDKNNVESNIDELHGATTVPTVN